MLANLLSEGLLRDMGFHVDKFGEQCVIWKEDEHGDTAATSKTHIPVSYHREAQVHVVRGFVSRDPKGRPVLYKEGEGRQAVEVARVQEQVVPDARPQR